MSYEMMQNNKVYITGTVVGEPIFSHEILGEGFYEVAVAVKRLSGQSDDIPLTISERLLEDRKLQIGELI
ncbi:MAG: single-stranded DNA-binding protein, partial [Clostridia bacterium]